MVGPGETRVVNNRTGNGRPSTVLVILVFSDRRSHHRRPKYTAEGSWSSQKHAYANPLEMVWGRSKYWNRLNFESPFHQGGFRGRPWSQHDCQWVVGKLEAWGEFMKWESTHSIHLSYDLNLLFLLSSFFLGTPSLRLWGKRWQQMSFVVHLRLTVVASRYSRVRTYKKDH